MKIKKLYSYSDKKQIWRLLLSDSEKLIVETRDIDEKQVYFHVLDLFSGKKILKKFQLDEKYWVSIEAVEKDIIFFHTFSKPDLPGHKKITAYDINTNTILWRNDNYTFLFINEKGLYAQEKGFASNKYLVLDLRTGSILEELDTDETAILELNHQASTAKDYSEYLFPERFYQNDENKVEDNLKNSLIEETKGLDIVGPVEYVYYSDALFFNFHYRLANKIVNRFLAKDISSGKKFFDDLLNQEVNAYVPDSFFIYKDLIILLKEKREVLVCKLTD